MDGATYLMDRPPGGWSDLATHRDIDALEARLDRRFEALEASIDRRFAEFEKVFDAKLAALEKGIDARIEQAFKSQLHWIIGTMIGISAAMVAAIKF